MQILAQAAENNFVFQKNTSIVLTLSRTICVTHDLGAIQVLRNTMGDGGVRIRLFQCYEGVRLKLLALQGSGRSPVYRKKRYITLEWPL